MNTIGASISSSGFFASVYNSASRSVGQSKGNVNVGGFDYTDTVTISGEAQAAGYSSLLVRRQASVELLKTVQPNHVDLLEPPTAPSTEARNWALGFDADKETPWTSRSERLLAKTQSEITERSANARIAEALKRNGITLGKGEKLDFSVDQDGRVSLGDGPLTERQYAIQQALNLDPEIGRELLLFQTQRDYSKKAVLSFPDESYNAVIHDAYGRSTGEAFESYESANGKKAEFRFDFSYMDDALLHDGTSMNSRVMADRMDGFESLSLLVGLEEPAADMASFLEALDKAIADEATELTKIFDKLLKDAGLEGETKKVTFSQDADGNIVIEGNIRADKRKELERLVNADTELVERIKTQKAKTDIAEEIRQATADGPDMSRVFSGDEAHAALLKFQQKPDGFDLAAEHLAPAREQLLKDFLKRNDVSLSEIAVKQAAQQGGDGDRLVMQDGQGNDKTTSEFLALLDGLPGLEGELKNYLNEPKTSTTSDTGRPLLSMKRGVLSAETDEPEIDHASRTQKIRSWVSGYVSAYNEEVPSFDDGGMIVDYTMKIDDRGRMVVENVKTRDGDPDSIRRATQYINKMVGGVSEMTEIYAEDLLAEHDDEHGDTSEFKHFIEISRSMAGSVSSDFEIKSPEADQAALAEFQQVGAEVGEMLGGYFRTAFNITEPFSIHWDGDKLALDTSLAGSRLGLKVSGVLDLLNERIAAEDPFDDSKFGDTLGAEQKEIVEKLMELKEIRDKFHEPELKNAGMTFVIRER